MRIFWKKHNKICKNAVYRTLFLCYNKLILYFIGKENSMTILPLHPEDRIQMKKPHPCGNRRFTVLRVGGEMRIRCLGCGHDMVIDRIKLEKAVKHLYPAEPTDGEA